LVDDNKQFMETYVIGILTK